MVYDRETGESGLVRQNRTETMEKASANQTVSTYRDPYVAPTMNARVAFNQTIYAANIRIFRPGQSISSSRSKRLSSGRSRFPLRVTKINPNRESLFSHVSSVTKLNYDP